MKKFKLTAHGKACVKANSEFRINKGGIIKKLSELTDTDCKKLGESIYFASTESDDDDKDQPGSN